MNWIEKNPDPLPPTHLPYKVGVKKLKRDGGREGRKRNLGQYFRYGIQTRYDRRYNHVWPYSYSFRWPKKTHTQKRKKKKAKGRKRNKNPVARLCYTGWLSLGKATRMWHGKIPNGTTLWKTTTPRWLRHNEKRFESHGHVKKKEKQKINKRPTVAANLNDYCLLSCRDNKIIIIIMYINIWRLIVLQAHLYNQAALAQQ